MVQKKITAKSKTTMNNGNPRWGVVIDGQWYNTIDEHLGSIVDTLNKGDTVDIELIVTPEGWKNIGAIDKIINVDGGEPEPKLERKQYRGDGGDEKDRSIRYQGISKSPSTLDNLAPAVQMFLIDDLSESPVDEKVAILGDRLGKLKVIVNRVVIEDMERYMKGE